MCMSLRAMPAHLRPHSRRRPSPSPTPCQVSARHRVIFCLGTIGWASLLRSTGSSRCTAMHSVQWQWWVHHSTCCSRLCAVIPPFHSAVDQAISYLDPVHGLMGVTDFYVSAKFDLPLRQMSWARRFFWRCVPNTTEIFRSCTHCRSFLLHVSATTKGVILLAFCAGNMYRCVRVNI